MKWLRKILFPFSLLYGSIAALRNIFFDKGWFESRTYDLPIICVGNLSTGGTGKSPLIEFLITLLSDEYRVAVLSRGYKRKTKGFREVNLENTAYEVGDEPLQFKQNFPKVTIAVCADRREGIERLKSKADVILLDDAFQHRRVKASINILLTPFSDLYCNDYVLPTGNLREFRSGAKRADFVVVTKCPEGIPYAELQDVQFDLKLETYQKLYFSKIGYDENIYGPSETLPLDYLKDKAFTLVTGIAKPKPLIDYLKGKEFQFECKRYPDHHSFSISDIRKLQEKEIILTTEKDYMRLQPKLGKFAIYYLPIKTIILKEQEEFFRESILESVTKVRLS
jgi:tetraacyldisaccharide 4'-kinase